MSILSERRPGASRQLMVLLKSEPKHEGQQAAGAAASAVEAAAAVEAGLSEVLAPFQARLELVIDSPSSAQAAAAAAAGPESMKHRERLALYRHVIAKDQDLEALRDQLEKHPSVAAAYIKRPGQPPALVARGYARAMMPVLAASDTPDFTSRQGYLGPAPVGVDALYAWRIRGGAGAGTRVIDCEWAWNFNHEDLATHCNGAVVGTPGTTDLDHGTAVIGEVIGNANGFGITGVAPEAVLGTACFGDSDNTATSTIIQQAADKLSPGNILLLEIHRAGPDTPNPENGQLGYIPIEWWPDDFHAIAYATAKGILVVEAGGNGSENLDDPLYSTPQQGFPADWQNPFAAGGPDSGAIIVGAGNPPAGTHGRTQDTLGFGETYVDRARCTFSNYGQRVDCQAWGWEVTTLGYGDLQPGAGGGIQASDQNRLYTDVFAGTSSASPIVTGVLACAQGALRTAGRLLFTPQSARQILRTTGSAQQSANNRPATQHIGNRPDLRAILQSVLQTPAPVVPLHAASAAANGGSGGVNGRQHLGWISLGAVLAALAVTIAMASPNVSAPWLNHDPLLAWLCDLGFVTLFFGGLGWTVDQTWLGVAVDWRNKISLSRLQIVVWTIFFVATLLVAFSWNAAHGAGVTLTVPNTIWLLMGISGVTAVGGPLILSQKPDAPRGIAPLPPSGLLVQGVVVTRPMGTQPSWFDVIRGDEVGNATEIDVGKVQQLLLTAVAVVSYGMAIAKLLGATQGHIAELPPMSGGFLSLLAASSATYLAYKAVPHT